MNRQYRRAKQSQLRGHMTTTTITLDPKFPSKGLSVPKGHRMSTGDGLVVETVESVLIEKKWWWKIAAFFNRSWRPQTKVKVRFV